MDDTILRRLKNEMEGKCIKEGFVREKSIKILKRSFGTAQTSAFNGCMTVNVEYSMDICNPLLLQARALVFLMNKVSNVRHMNINKMIYLQYVLFLAGKQLPYEQSSPLNN